MNSLSHPTLLYHCEATQPLPRETSRLLRNIAFAVSLVLVILCSVSLSAYVSEVPGLDVSHHQNDAISGGIINWTSVYGAGYRFVFVKASEGDDIPPLRIDPYFETNMIGARNAGLLAGAYHFAYPDLKEADAEARHFLNVAGDYITEGYLRPALDVERGGGRTEQEKEELSNWIETWMTTVEAATGVKPLLYVTSNYANNCLKSWVNKYDVWIAQWRLSTGCTTAIPPDTGIWNGEWAFWQYWAPTQPGINGCGHNYVPGVGNDVDLDVFNGNISDLDAFVISAAPLYAGKGLDVVLDIDRSGSMRDQKIIDAKDAAKMFVSLLENRDQVGLVSFSDDARLDLHLTSDFDGARHIIGGYVAGGYTNMRDALRKSIDELKANARTDTIHSIILFTDGVPEPDTDEQQREILENLVPEAVEAGISIYTCGYGTGWLDEPFLEQVAREGNGKYYYAPSAWTLIKIYVELSQGIRGIKKVEEFVDSVTQGGTRRHTFLVETAIRFLRLFLLWPGSDLDLRVLDPSGNLVAPGPKVIYSGNAAFPEYYEIHDPLPGNWTIEVYGKDVTDTTEEYSVMVFQPAALMQVRPTSCQINYPTSKTTTFTVSEVAGMVDLKNVVVTASELTAIQTTSTTTEVIVQSDLREREELQPVSSQAQSIPMSSFSFTPNNFTLPAGGSQDITATLSIPAGTPLGDYSGTINVNSSDGTAQISVMVTVTAEPSQPEGAFVTDKDAVTIPEGGTATLGVKLSAQPLSTTRARISWISGDSSITVKGNANLTFDRTNWNTYQYVSLAAARDADSDNGTAVIRIHRIAGDPIPYKDITAIEQDQPGNCATFSAGWNLMSIPVEPDDPSPEAVFDEVSPLHLYTYNGTDYDSFKSSRLTTVKALNGYWLLLDRTTRVCVDGTVLTGNQSLQLGKAGWQMIGVPYPVTWGSPGPPPPPPDTAALDFPTSFSPMVQTPSGSITVTKGTQTTTLAAAVTAGWIYDTIWEYNTTSGKYTSATLSGGKTLNPWTGYWVLTYEDHLLLNFSQTGGSPGLPPPPPAEMPAGLRVPASPPPPPALPGTFSVEDGLEFTNIPNPITDVHTTTFMVKGPMAALVEAIKVQIFDLSGRLVYEEEMAGTSIDWHTDNDYGELLANGVYLYRMYALIDGEWIESKTRKLAILR